MNQRCCLVHLPRQKPEWPTWFLWAPSCYSWIKTVFCCSCYSAAKSYLTLCDPVNCSTPGRPVLHYLPEFAQIHVHWVSDAIQPSHPLPSASPFACNLSQPQGLFQWVSFRIRWPKYWNFSFSIRPSNEYWKGWFPLELTGLFSLLSKGLSRIFSSITIRKHQFFSAQLSS